MAKRERKSTKYLPELKLSIIMDIRENHLGYCEIVIILSVR